MALKIGAGKLADMEAQVNRARQAAKNARTATDKAVKGVIGTMAVSGTAFAFGAIEGYTGGVEVVGVPLPLGVGLLGHGAALLIGGETAHYIHAAADGALASYASTLGRGVGRDMKAKGGGAQAALAGRAADALAGADDDLRRLAQGQRLADADVMKAAAAAV